MDAPPGEVAVFSGNAHLEGGNGALAMDLHGGESLALIASDPGRSVVSETIEPDSWDAWNSDRDQALTAEASAQTGASSNISPDEGQNPAWNDLDANGNWYNVPGQGYVWSPYDAANTGWDPYGNGNWMFTPGYGYIWTSGYSWGYMPYQCGAWNFYNGFGWGWAPGMGGCQPWWGSGSYGGPRFGSFLPGGYRLPRRPGPPREPGRGRPVPVIAVNRRMNGAGGLPLRDRNTPVTIAGNRVQALHPIPERSGYQHEQSDFVHHEAQVYGNQARPVNSMPRSGYTPGRGSYAPAPGGGQFHPTPSQGRGYSGAGPAPGPSSNHGSAGGGGSAPHSMGGGGGGGGAPRGGGGGGGAPSGGGGGGGSHGGGGGGVGGGGGGGGGHK
jgi:hypothetical protein